MSFRQKTSRTRNRRLSNVRQRRQQHLLDVKVRSRRATQHRIRNAMGMVWKAIMLVVLCGAGYVGAREARGRSSVGQATSSPFAAPASPPGPVARRTMPTA